MTLKTHANRHNIVGQQHATLLGLTCYVRLHVTTTMLALVAYSLKLVKLLTQQVPTFLFFCDQQSIVQQCCTRLYGTTTILAS